MAKPATRKTSNILMVAESVLNLAALPLGLVTVGMSLGEMFRWTQLSEEMIGTEGVTEAIEELQTVYDPSGIGLMAFLFLLVLAAARVLRGFRFREKKGAGFFRISLVQGAAFAVCGALPLVIGFTFESSGIAALGIGLALIAGRVWAIVHDHRARSILVNLIAAGLIVFCALAFLTMAVLLFLLSVLSLMSIVFSGISFPILKKILVKTHAAEIIFGLVLLIVTFSMLLTFFEPGMDNFKDALWYCFAIVTTIGFGDLTAVTDFGRVLSVILGAYGIIVVALITSIIVNFYGEVKTSPDSGSGDETGTEEG